MPNFKNYFCKTELTLYQKSLNGSFLFLKKKIKLPKLFGLQMRTENKKQNFWVINEQEFGNGPKTDFGGGSQKFKKSWGRFLAEWGSKATEWQSGIWGEWWPMRNFLWWEWPEFNAKLLSILFRVSFAFREAAISSTQESMGGKVQWSMEIAIGSRIWSKIWLWPTPVFGNTKEGSELSYPHQVTIIQDILII